MYIFCFRWSYCAARCTCQTCRSKVCQDCVAASWLQPLTSVTAQPQLWSRACSWKRCRRLTYQSVAVCVFLFVVHTVFCLTQVQSLVAPASRCLVTAVTSLANRYPRPVCNALIMPMLDHKDIGMVYLWAVQVTGMPSATLFISFISLTGIPQAELLNRLIEGCLDTHYRLLVLQ